MLDMNKTAVKCRVFALLLLASIPLMTGCDPASVAATTFGTVFWIDIALTPLRSLLGGAALDIVNTF